MSFSLVFKLLNPYKSTEPLKWFGKFGGQTLIKETCNSSKEKFYICLRWTSTVRKYIAITVCVFKLAMG